MGEWGTAGDVWQAVEELGLDEVQHGIAAAQSPAVMRFLADHKPDDVLIFGSSVSDEYIRLYYLATAFAGLATGHGRAAIGSAADRSVWVQDHSPADCISTQDYEGSSP